MSNKFNKLRVEKRLILSRLSSLENKLNKGAFNTRQFHSDSNEIANLRIRLNEIDTEIFLETSKINKQKIIDFNRTQSPLPTEMFTTPPKNRYVPETEERILNNSNEENISPEPQKIESTPVTTERISTDVTSDFPRKSGLSDFQNFINKTIGLKATGGAIPKEIPKPNTLAVTMKQLNNLFSNQPVFEQATNNFSTQTVQVHKKPKQTIKKFLIYEDQAENNFNLPSIGDNFELKRPIPKKREPLTEIQSTPYSQIDVTQDVLNSQTENFQKNKKIEANLLQEALQKSAQLQAEIQLLINSQKSDK